MFIASKCRLRLNERKLSNRLTAAILKDCRLKNIENSKYQLIFATAEEVLSKPFLSWLKKKLPTVLLIGATYLSFCRKTVLAVFNLTYFDWLLAPFRKYSDVQPIRGCFTFQHPLPPTLTVHPNFKPNMDGRINDRELITLARTNNAYTAG